MFYSGNATGFRDSKTGEMSHFCLEFINTRLRTSFDINKNNNENSTSSYEFDNVWSGMECFWGERCGLCAVCEIRV